MDPRRLAAAAVAHVARTGTGRRGAQPALAPLALEDSRQSPPEHRRAVPARLPRGRLDPAARLTAPLDSARPRRRGRTLDTGTPARVGPAPARQVVARLLRGRGPRCGDECPASGARDRLPPPSGVGL